MTNLDKIRYNIYMYNWSTDISLLKKHPQKLEVWRLEQLINYGLGQEKISKQSLKKNIEKLDIDPQKKKYLEFLLQ